MTDHIQMVAGRYRGKIQIWDVVNEAIDPKNGRPDGLRSSPWLDLIGPEYIDLAVITAAQVDPAAKLTYNDGGIELDTPDQSFRRGQVLALLKGLKSRRVPIHAVGIQSHLYAVPPFPGAGLIAFIREVRDLGLDVYITEMDVNSVKVPGGIREQDSAVARVYRDYIRMLVAEPNVKAVITWGISSASTPLNQMKKPWITRPDGSPQRPLLFDDAYVPTPAFFAVRDAIDTAQG